MNYIKKLCQICTIEFDAPLSEIKRGNGKFCSKNCSLQNTINKRKTKCSEPKAPNNKCAYCTLEFFRRPSSSKNSKSGLSFCSREHKDLAQRLESGFDAIHPPHYGKNNGLASYRDIALRNLPNKCSNCSYDKYIEVLDVHHIDENRSNNDLSNLKLLCPTCHVEQHFLHKTGRYGAGRPRKN